MGHATTLVSHLEQPPTLSDKVEIGSHFWVSILHSENFSKSKKKGLWDEKTRGRDEPIINIIAWKGIGDLRCPEKNDVTAKVETGTI